jgi:multidrug resistance efflux pump
MPRQPATVEQVFVKVGQRVEKGQVILTFETSRAKVDLLRRQYALERVLARKRGALEEAGTVAGEIDVKEALLELGEARRALADMELRSPFAGVVVQLGAHPGDLLAPVSGSPIVVADPSSMAVELEADEYQVSRVRAGQSARVFIDALGVTPIV